MQNNSWEIQGSVIKIQIMEGITLKFKETSAFPWSFKVKLTAYV